MPAPLAGLVVGALAAYVANHWLGGDIATIASRFEWSAEGESGIGIPPIAPSFALPGHREPRVVAVDRIKPSPNKTCNRHRKRPG